MSDERYIIIGCCAACTERILADRNLSRGMVCVYVAGHRPEYVERALRGYRYDKHTDRIMQCPDAIRPFDAVIINRALDVSGVEPDDIEYV